MEDKRLKRVFDQVRLSQEREEAMLADLLNEKKEVSGMKQTNNRHRIPAAALVAAVLVIALAGTAVAASYFGRLDVLPAEGGYENGYHIWGAYQNIPPERLSKELLDYAALLSHLRARFLCSLQVPSWLFLSSSQNPRARSQLSRYWQANSYCFCGSPCSARFRRSSKKALRALQDFD